MQPDYKTIIEAARQTRMRAVILADGRWQNDVDAVYYLEDECDGSTVRLVVDSYESLWGMAPLC